MICKGQTYRPKIDLPVICMTSWAAPFTGGYDHILPRGETFIIANDPPPDATAVYADVVNYHQLHSYFVSRGDRWRFWVYRGYYLCIDIEQIQTDCELVADV
ncbi:MAG: hypothetical protein ACP5D7_17255 [Limnospira sp.]